MPQRMTMSQDELSMIVQFAPVSLIVLDRNRCLKRVNKLAEAMLGINAARCQGEPFSQWVVESSQTVLGKAMNHAAESRWSRSFTSASWAQPAATSIAMQTRRTGRDKPGKPFWASVTCTACFDSPAGSGAELLHEAWYIISITPVSMPEKGRANDALTFSDSSYLPMNVDSRQYQQEQADPNETDEENMDNGVPHARALQEAVIHHLDIPLIAMSKDGRAIIRNRAADALLDILCAAEEDFEGPFSSDGSSEPSSDSNGSSSTRDEVDCHWFFSHFKLYDTSFTHPLPTHEYPLYKAGVLGQKVRHGQYGVLAKGAQRKIIEVECYPLYDGEGLGHFIGGLAWVKDITRQHLTTAEQHPIYLPPSSMADGSDAYRNLCQDLPEIAWIASADGYLEWYNKRWYEYTGATVEQSVGAGWTSFVHEADLPHISRIWSRALRTEARYDVQERMRGKDGRYRWMLCRAHPFRDSDGNILRWFGMLTDVHSTLNTLAANKEARDNLTDAVRVADITLWSVDQAGVFTLAEGSLAGHDPHNCHSSVSASAASSDDTRVDLVRTLSVPKAYIVGKSIFSEWGEARRGPIQRALAGELVVEESTIRGRTYRTQYRPQRARMSAPTSFLLSAEDEEAEVVGVTGMSFDITERLAMERKFEESVREIARAEAASAAAREASRMKSQFLAVISHEIRTPLNGVVGLSELLLDIEALPQEAQDLVHSILRSSGALLTVINDVLDFSKVEAGKLDLVSLPFSLRLVCEDSVRDFQKLMNSKGLQLIKDLNLPDDTVMGDAGRITQVLNNLLGNAGKFTEKGSVTFSATNTRVGDIGSYYTFKVTDTGCGIPESQRSFLFQPFRQADPSTSRRYGGSGLGLAICRNLIELMGGEISLESQEGVGTTVTFTIPFSKAPPVRTPRDEISMPTAHTDNGMVTTTRTTTTTTTTTCVKPPSHIDLPSDQYLGLRRSSLATQCLKPRILLAEDNPVNSQIAIKTLAKLGYDVDHVENGEEVLEAFRKQQYSLVLMDCMMPVMDGYMATRAMRSSGSAAMRRIPVIALTAAAIKGRDLCLAAGMTDYLSKPVRRATLDAMLSKWLGREHDETQVISSCSSTSTTDSAISAGSVDSGISPATTPASSPSVLATIKDVELPNGAARLVPTGAVVSPARMGVTRGSVATSTTSTKPIDALTSSFASKAGEKNPFSGLHLPVPGQIQMPKAGPGGQ